MGNLSLNVQDQPLLPPMGEIGNTAHQPNPLDHIRHVDRNGNLQAPTPSSSDRSSLVPGDDWSIVNGRTCISHDCRQARQSRHARVLRTSSTLIPRTGFAEPAARYGGMDIENIDGRRKVIHADPACTGYHKRLPSRRDRNLWLLR